MKKIKVSFIGGGLQSQIAHLPNFYQDKRVQLFDIADFDEKIRKGVYKSFHFSGIDTNSVDELIKRKPDAVVIVVQRPLITNLVLKCLNKKIHVLSEKPHVFSSLDFKKCQKIQKTIWMKGYNRRWAEASIKLKKDLKNLEKKFGKINSIKLYCDNGNSWLGSKHHILPSLKYKKFSGIINNYPKWLKSNYKKIYEKYWNGAAHFLDLLEFLGAKREKNFKSLANENIFKSLFKVDLLSSKNIIVDLTMSRHSHNGWSETFEVFFENGKVDLRFKSPMQKGGSCTYEIFNSKTNQHIVKSFKNNWHFENQSKNFISSIQKFRKKYNNKDGESSIRIYEKIWKNILNK
jgi:predicted dehydrogenase